MDQQKQIHKWLKKVIGDDAERMIKAQTLGKGGECCDFHFYRK